MVLPLLRGAHRAKNRSDSFGVRAYDSALMRRGVFASGSLSVWEPAPGRNYLNPTLMGFGGRVCRGVKAGTKLGAMSLGGEADRLP